MGYTKHEIIYVWDEIHEIHRWLEDWVDVPNLVCAYLDVEVRINMYII